MNPDKQYVFGGHSSLLHLAHPTGHPGSKSLPDSHEMRKRRRKIAAESRRRNRRE